VLSNGLLIGVAIFWSADAYGVGLSLLCMATIITSFILIYVAETKLTTVEAILSRSKMVVDMKSQLENAGLLGRMGRLSMVFVCLLFSRYWVRKGLADVRDIHAMPKSLALWVLIPNVVSFFILVGLYIYP
jgi:hypothetical protein